MSLLIRWLILVFFFAPQVNALAAITGHVINEQQEPIPFAVLEIQSLPDSAVLKIELTDTSGNFKINSNIEQRFLLKIISQGYLTTYKELHGTNVSLGDLVLKTDSKLLSDVTIIASKPLIEHKVDRMVFNVESSIASTGSDAFEMLKKAPGVRVDNNNISITGKSSVSIMVNDKLIRLSGDELEAYLRSITSDNLSRIEVITTPPAKYDAEGNAGLINIVTKKINKDGLNGNLNASYQQRYYGSKRISGVFNFRKRKLNVYGNSSFNSLVFTSFQNTSTSYTNQELQQNYVQQNSPTYSRTELGMDYQLTPKSIIGILYTIGNTAAHRSQQYHTTMMQLPEESIDSILKTNAYVQEIGLRNVVNLNYEWKIDTTGKQLHIEAEYFTRTGKTDRSFLSNNFFADGSSTGWNGNYLTSGKQVINITTAKTDLDWPTKFANFSFGGKVAFINNTSNNIFQQYQTSSFLTDSSKSNWFDYSEHTQALYLNAKKTFGKWEIQLGLRGEYTQTKAVSHSLNQTNANNYFKLFPTFYLQYSEDDNHVFNLNYSRRIDRPSMGELNPFREYSTTFSYESGNPFLQPGFSHNIELAYTLNNKYTATFFIERVIDVPTSISIVDTTTSSFHFSIENAGNETNYGLSITAAFTLTKWWETNVQVYAYYNSFSSSFYGNNTKVFGMPSYSMQASNNFNINYTHTLLAECNLSYTAKQQSETDKQQAIFSVSGGFKALFFHKKLVAALNIVDILHSEHFVFVNDFNGSKTNTYYDGQYLALALTWKFGNQNLKEKRQLKIDTEETKRAE